MPKQLTRWRLLKWKVQDKWRAWRMPNEKAALKKISWARERLRELGWREAMYCPKDGREFAAIEFGSTGIHRCTYNGDWPSGSYDLYSCGDVWPSNPVLFHPDTSLIDPENPQQTERWQQELENMARPDEENGDG